MEYAFFVSPHGFGHASRSLALMEALRGLDDQAFFHLFTTVPSWFFEAAIGGHFRYHPLACDVGFVQQGPFQIDFPATRNALAGLLPFRSDLVDGICREMASCRLVISDISSLGLYAASRAGIASVLVENFTWDYLYGFFADRHPFFKEWIELLGRSFSLAGHHVQTEPLCRWAEGVDLTVGPICRRPAMAREEVRERLRIGESQKIVLVSLGGFPAMMAGIDAAASRFPDTVFVVPTGREDARSRENVIFLPRNFMLPHVAIVHAADGLICKAGYSTLAEGYCAGVPVAAIVRENYPETPALAAFVEQKMGGVCLPEQCMTDGSWVAALSKLLAQGRKPARASAAGPVARFLLERSLEAGAGN